MTVSSAEHWHLFWQQLTRQNTLWYEINQDTMWGKILKGHNDISMNFRSFSELYEDILYYTVHVYLQRCEYTS